MRNLVVWVAKKVPVGRRATLSRSPGFCHWGSDNWKGIKCENCSAGYFGEDCTVFCAPTEHYYCSVTGEKICLDITTNAKNNCTEELPINAFAALATGAIVMVVISLALALEFLKAVIRLKRKTKENKHKFNLTARQTKKLYEIE